MTDKDPMTMLHHCGDILTGGLESRPMDIDRPAKEDFVVVSTETYLGLLQRIGDLEQATMIEVDREVDEEEFLRMLVEAANIGSLHGLKRSGLAAVFFSPRESRRS